MDIGWEYKSAFIGVRTEAPLMPTGQWKHQYRFDTSTTFRAVKHFLEGWRSLEPLNDTTVLLRAQALKLGADLF